MSVELILINLDLTAFLEYSFGSIPYIIIKTLIYRVIYSCLTSIGDHAALLSAQKE